MLRRYKKGIAIVLLLTFGQEIFLPTTVWALTGGPSQPEVNSFEPVGTNQMVDLSSGDFNYNIPLMVVPGPNGGYPINIAYHAGIGMEQEASWVGLGWNINPGAITRNLRGVPDDFSGDKIVKSTNLKKDITVGMSLNMDQLKAPEQDEEKFGYKHKDALFPPQTIKVNFNNYRGVGYNYSFTPTGFSKYVGLCGKIDGELTGNLGFSFGSNTGLGVEGNISLSRQNIHKKRNWESKGFGAGISLNTRQGMVDLRLNRERNSEKKGKYRSRGSSISFSTQTYVPAINNTMVGGQYSLGIAIARMVKAGVFKRNYKITGEVMMSWIKSRNKTYEAFGSIYLQERPNYYDDLFASDEYDLILDANIFNDNAINKRSVNMGIPVMTNDIYQISGQGIGGSFRAHRNDIGRFYPTGNTSNVIPVSSSAEFGAGTVPPIIYNHLGLDESFGIHNSYTGKWTNGTKELDGNFRFKKTYDRVPLYEPFYFKIFGEKTAINSTEWNSIQNENPIAFDLGVRLEGASLKTRVKNNASNYGGFIEPKSKYTARVKRLQNIEYKKKEELIGDENYGDRVSHTFLSSDIPGVDDGAPIDYNSIDGTDENVDHHISEYSILRPDGSRYTYGLPAYNTERKEVLFANREGVIFDGLDKYSDLDLVSYNVDDATIDNDEGVDHYYSSTEIPPYIHSHMITEITSADYVDLTGNGLSEDDFGFYTKFNYIQILDYNWRDPFFKANYIKGHYSNEMDDKASYIYGKKNLHYVHSIETKTHIAIFETEERADGLGVKGEHQAMDDLDGAPTQRYLKTIKLYSKNDIERIVVDGGGDISDVTPLQTVHFDYSYELCQNIYNNNGDAGDVAHFETANEGGKLTLKRIYITYNGNDKGRLSPYEFDYASNPNYSRLDIDRWGNFQTASGADPFENILNPYTQQTGMSTSTRNANAGAWCLSKIDLPSGGIINVNYESDDYGYVQDHRAAQMMEIYGFTKTDVNTAVGVAVDDLKKLKKKNLRLWFKADKLSGVTDDDERNSIVEDYIQGINEVYFKVYQDLKRPVDVSFGTKAKDYVVGYAKINNASSGADSDISSIYGYVDLQPVHYKTKGLDVFSTHPFRKAGWQYLKYSRNDLFNDQVGYDSFVDGLVSSALSIPVALYVPLENALLDLAAGEYNRFRIHGFCKTMNNDKKSFIRLNSPDHFKYGGGHRVKSIVLNDNWVEGDREFSTEYSYKTKNGYTSGVADYEPIIGGEENALKKPIWFNGNDKLISFQDQDMFLETPLSEGVYPGARIVYSRVVTKNSGVIDSDYSASDDVSKSQSSIAVSEYYTAKDFPVITDYTRLKKSKGYTVVIYIPFVGLETVNNKGYSQGYSVILNDMSGKPKSMATYPYRNGEVEGLPISEVKYRYKTDEYGHLNNTVKVLDKHGVTRMAEMGVEIDFSIYEDENSSYTEVLSTESNVDTKSNPTIPSVIPIPSFKMMASHSEAMYRGISTSKIIYKTGILEEVEVFTDGSTVVTKNILYDAETGEALLTQVNNEWDKPVYNYTYPAHWNYDRMGGAYKNYRAHLKLTGEAGVIKLMYLRFDDEVEYLSVKPILTLGDEITINDAGVYKTYYVTNISEDGTSFTLEDKDGVSIGFGTDQITGTITRSGRRNQQSIKSGSVVALNKEFVTGASLTSFSRAWNEYILDSDPEIGFDPAERFYLNANTNAVEPWPISFSSLNRFLPNIYHCKTGNYSFTKISSLPIHYDNNEIKIDQGNCISVFRFRDMEDGLPINTPKINSDIFPVVIGSETSYTEQLVNFEIVSEKWLGTLLQSVDFYCSTSGITYTADWIPEVDLGCFPQCYEFNILHADAITFSDDWADVYPYQDLGDPFVNESEGIRISDADINEYRYGKKGIWRPKKSYLYQIDRKQSGISGDESRINVDGEYLPWEPYNWIEGNLNPKWDWVSEITRYSPYGFAIEEKSRLGYTSDDGTETAIMSSQMYGYDNSVVTATSALASYFEIGFIGFEQGIGNNTGHINLSSTGAYTVADNKTHTGEKSLKVINTEEISFISTHWDVGDIVSDNLQVLKGIPQKEYIVSLWVNVEDPASEGTLTVYAGGTPVSVSTSESREIIDGWKKLELKYEMPNTGNVEIKYTSTGTTYVDDLRIGPYEGGMVTYVYDTGNLWLIAELDGLNYATFYNYDEEGNLVQVKKETENGIVTIQTARSNTVQTP